jgi:hypothetical protein
LAKQQAKSPAVMDQGGGTGGVIERNDSVDSLEKEMIEIDKSASQVQSSLSNAEVNHRSVSESRISVAAELSMISEQKNDKDEPEIIVEQSRISKTLTEQTMQAIVIIILSLLFLLPILHTDTYDGENSVNSDMLRVITNIYQGQSWQTYKNGVNLMI